MERKRREERSGSSKGVTQKAENDTLKSCDKQKKLSNASFELCRLPVIVCKQTLSLILIRLKINRRVARYVLAFGTIGPRDMKVDIAANFLDPRARHQTLRTSVCCSPLVQLKKERLSSLFQTAADLARKN